jgi:hypothetical protein
MPPPLPVVSHQADDTDAHEAEGRWFGNHDIANVAVNTVRRGHKRLACNVEPSIAIESGKSLKEIAAVSIVTV